MKRNKCFEFLSQLFSPAVGQNMNFNRSFEFITQHVIFKLCLMLTLDNSVPGGAYHKNKLYQTTVSAPKAWAKNNSDLKPFVEQLTKNIPNFDKNRASPFEYAFEFINVNFKLKTQSNVFQYQKIGTLSITQSCEWMYVFWRAYSAKKVFRGYVQQNNPTSLGKIAFEKE